VTPFDGYVEQPGRVSSTCLISAARNRYSVPCELAGKLNSKRLYSERIVVVFDDTVVANHPRQPPCLRKKNRLNRPARRNPADCRKELSPIPIHIA
jgi:hypothetical protein